MQRTRNRIRVAIAIGVVALVATATGFVVRTRHDLDAAAAGIRTSRANLSALRTELRDAVGARTEAQVALDDALEVLRADTAARDRLLETNRSEFRLLVARLESLAAHQAELAANAARAKRLDDCLIGASQALNAAAVGDVVTLEELLPRAQDQCAEADA